MISTDFNLGGAKMPSLVLGLAAQVLVLSAAIHAGITTSPVMRSPVQHIICVGAVGGVSIVYIVHMFFTGGVKARGKLVI